MKALKKMKRRAGTVVDSVRAAFLVISNPRLSIGERVKICRGFRPSRIYPTSIGPFSFVGFGFYSSVPIEIGSKVMIAPRVSIVGGDHDLLFSPDRCMIDAPRPSARKVVVEEGSWIGCGAVILHGVVIGKGAVIGAGSVVTKNVGPCEVVAGNPARLIYSRLPVNG
jgi:acetyltransferase-like isoleucine patch superfamily enzyme